MKTTLLPLITLFFVCILSANSFAHWVQSLKVNPPERLCPALKPSSPGVEMHCRHAGINVPLNCSDYLPPGTTVIFKCKKYYKESYGNPGGMQKCTEDGYWSRMAIFLDFRCQIDCGKRHRSSQELIIYGNVVPFENRKEWPWHAALFRDRNGISEYICGGSLITPSFILTAAHCVTLFNSEVKFNPKAFTVVLGSMSSNLTNNLEDGFAQIMHVSAIEIPSGYDSSTVGSDIALMRLTTPVILSDYVLPVCFPYRTTENDFITTLQVDTDNHGEIAGFGFDESIKLSIDLKSTVLPVVSAKECHKELGRIPSSSQFCAGFKTGTSLCGGDSGGGLVFAESRRYFVQGVVSAGSSEHHAIGRCQNYVIFTRVYTFALWVQDIIQSAPSPDQPPQFKESTNPNTTPRNVFHPQTSSSVSPLPQPATSSLYIPLPPPTRIPQRFPIKTPTPRVSVSTPLPVSSSTTIRISDLTCGRSYISNRRRRVAGGKEAVFGKWPWMISVTFTYEETETTKCGATLLNKYWAITSANCVHDLKPHELILRMGSNIISPKTIPQRGNYVERRVKEIVIHPEYKPYGAPKYEYSERNIALLQFTKPVPLQNNIVPICLPQSDTDYLHLSGYVTGWGRPSDEANPLLQEIELPIIESERCRSAFSAGTSSRAITNLSLCVGGIPFSDKGICSSDGGGPFVLRREDNQRWEIAGVLSEFEYCGLGKPRILVRVSAFLDWIKNTIRL